MISKTRAKILRDRRGKDPLSEDLCPAEDR